MLFLVQVGVVQHPPQKINIMTRDTEGNAIDLDALDDAIWKEGNDQTWFEPGSYRTTQSKTDQRRRRQQRGKRQTPVLPE